MRFTGERGGALRFSLLSSSLALHVHAIPWRRENVEFLQKQMEETPGGKMREDVARNMS